MSTATEPVLQSRREARTRKPRTRLDAFPRNTPGRWMLRLALMLPVLAVVLIDQLTAPLAGTPNDALTAGALAIEWNRGDSEWLSQLYPHVSMLLASANPFGRLGLGLIGAVASGFLLQKIAEIIAQRAIPRSTGIILILALAANPLYFYFAAQNMAGFLAVTFFGLALADLVRFVNWGNTESGFRAGLLLMVCAFADPTGLLFVAVAALVSPFLRPGRVYSKGLRAANLLVIAFPTIGAFTIIVLLNLIFFGYVWPAGILDTLAATPQRIAELPALYSTATGWLLAAPVVSAALVGIIVRRYAIIPAAIVVFVLINLALVLGMFAPGVAGVSFILLSLLAITLIPGARTRVTNVMVDVVAVVQLVIAWLAAFDRPIVAAWMDSIVDGAQILFGG